MFRTRGWPTVFLVTLLMALLPLQIYCLNLTPGNRPKFKKSPVQIFRGAKLIVMLKAEIADTIVKSEYGLMFVEKLDEGSGMLFIFSSEEVRNFWMKNTFVDLDIGYFDQKKILRSIIVMAKANSEMEANLPIYPSVVPAQYALEVPKGWFHKHKVKIGDKLVLP